MENSVTFSMAERQELEDTWRQRLEQLREKYRAASDIYRALLRKEPEGETPSPDSPLARARQAESEALLEYSRVLRLFSDLTLYGKLPEEEPAASSEPNQKKEPTLISVVDDDESIRDSTKKLLRSAGYRVETFAGAELFLRAQELTQTACIVLDVRMPGMDGLELQRRLNDSNAGLPIIFLTAHDDARSRRLAMAGGAVDFLCKPFEANTLVSAVETALARHAINRSGTLQGETS